KEAASQPSYVALLTGATDGKEQIEAAEKRLELAERAFADLAAAQAQLREDLKTARDDRRFTLDDVKKAIGALGSRQRRGCPRDHLDARNGLSLSRARLGMVDLVRIRCDPDRRGRHVGCPPRADLCCAESGMLILGSRF